MMFGTMLTACVERARSGNQNPGVSAQETEAVRRRVTSTTAPTPHHRLDFNFGNKLTLLGYDISPEQLRPGASATITWYWRADAATGDGWHLFTHVDDANSTRQNLDADGDVRRGYQPDRWRQGEFITDRQQVAIAADWGSPVVKIYVGLWKNDERMQVVRGAADHDRALAMTLNTGG